MSRIQKIASLKLLKIQLSQNPESAELKEKIASLESEITVKNEESASKQNVLKEPIPKKEEDSSEKKN